MRRLDSLAAREPVRVYVYGLVVALLAVLVTLDYLDKADVPVWLALAAAVLAVPSVEGARASVTSPATLASALAGRPTGDELAVGLRELANRPGLDSPTVSVLLDAAADLDKGTPPLFVMSKLVAAGLR